MIQEGKTYYFYDTGADGDVCKAHVLHILPHPERKDDRLIVYRWFGTHRRRWWYGVTTISQQELWAGFVKDMLEYRKKQQATDCRKCGQCGYYMAYVKSDGTVDHYGDCANIVMNRECNDGKNPFDNEEMEILQVDENEKACMLFNKKRTKRTKDYIKAHPHSMCNRQISYRKKFDKITLCTCSTR